MVSQDVITDNLVKQELNRSAVAVIPTNEVVFVSKNGLESEELLNRDELWRTQTPQSYYFDDLWKVHLEARNKGITDTVASCFLMHRFVNQST